MPDPARMLQCCVLGKQSLFDANGNARQDVVEYVVGGWEELLVMSEDDGAGNEESDPVTDEEVSEEWQ